MSIGLSEQQPKSDSPLDLDQVRIDPAWSLRIPASLALRKRVLPLCKLGDHVLVACMDTDDTATHQALRKYLEFDIQTLHAEPESLRRALMRVYGGVSTTASADASPVRVRARDPRALEPEDAVAICDELMQAAVLRSASDIHLLGNETSFMAQFRVDGRLEVYREFPLEIQGATISRLKVLAGLDIAEKRSPQDGRFTTRVGPSQRKVDVRVATLPTRHGERMTMRLLAAQGSELTLTSLGMNDNDLSIFRTAITRPHGLILLTGPTGSGKSTTLYAAIEELLTRRGGNVITVEDPIEYEMRGVSQVEVDSADKVNFGKALRSILRHDPDVIMIGEIRDRETADVAVKASLTGHLVFSTLHTNTAAGVVTRLVDMGMQRFLVAATLRLAVAQRLVRRLCPHCRKPRAMKPDEALALGKSELAGSTVYDSTGCVYCAGRGYIGRVAMFEMVESNESFARQISEGAGEDELLADVRARKLPLLVDDAVAKLADGTTTVQEVLNAVVTW